MKKEATKAKSAKSSRKKHSEAANKRFSLDIVDFLGLSAIVVLGFLIYSNTFNSAFHFDDFDNIVDNAIIRSLSNTQAMWEFSHTRVFAYWTFALNYHFSQFDVSSYHFLNIMIHLVTSCLVYWLTYLLLSSPVMKDYPVSRDKKALALMTAMLFVSHPLATQSVTYIIQRMASMAAMFYLLSIALYVMGRYTARSTRQYLLFAGCVVSAVLAMLTKENAFSIPFAIALVEVCFLRTDKNFISLKNSKVLLIGTALCIFIAFGIYKYSSFLLSSFPADPDATDKSITAATYLFTQFGVILKYIQLLILPLHLNLDYDYKVVYHFSDARSMGSLLLLLVILGLGIFLYKKQRLFAFGIFWFFLTLAIESSIIPLQDVIFEHRTYLPSFGFFLCMSYGVYLLLWKNYRRAAITVIAVIVGINSILAFDRNRVWKDEITLWTDVIEKSPNKARPYNNRGDDYVEAKQLKEAMSDFNKAIEINPKFVMAHYNRGNVYEKQEKYKESLDDYTTAIRLYPKFHKAYSNRGNIYKMLGRYDEAIVDYNQSINLEPNYYLAYNNRASVLIMQNKFEEAIADLNKCISLKPDLAEAYGNRGLIYLKMGNPQMGCLDLKQAVDLGFEPARQVLMQNCK